MPSKTPGAKQPKKKPTTAKKTAPVTNPGKKTIRKTGASAGRAEGSNSSKKEQPRPEIPYPGPSMALSEELRERIAQRAYEIHQRRGGEHGSDWEDWLQAEREILLRQPPIP